MLRAKRLGVDCARSIWSEQARDLRRTRWVEEEAFDGEMSDGMLD